MKAFTTYSPYPSVIILFKKALQKNGIVNASKLNCFTKFQLKIHLRYYVGKFTQNTLNECMRLKGVKR